MTNPRRDEDEPRRDAASRPTTRTGTDQPIDPEDLAMLHGLDPTPENVEWARRRLAAEGRRAVEREVP